MYRMCRFSFYNNQTNILDCALTKGLVSFATLQQAITASYPFIQLPIFKCKYISSLSSSNEQAYRPHVPQLSA